jgi:small-conductance mechanosensitive channel
MWISDGKNLVESSGFSAAAPEAMDKLRAFFVGRELLDWVWSLGVLACAVLVGWGGARVLLGLVIRAVGKTEFKADDIIVSETRGPLSWALLILSVRAVLPWISLPEEMVETVQQILLVSAVLCVGWLLLRLTSAVEEVVEQRFDVTVADNLRARAVHTQVRALRNVARLVIVVLTLGAALMTFSDVRAIGAGLLASTGVVGIILGFAAQRSIATVISGIHIALAQPIRVDDVLIVEGEWGRVEEITLTYVVIKIWDERRLVVPINYFVERPFQNWTRVSAELLGTIELHLDYSVPLEALRAELQRIVEASEHWDGRVCNIQVTGCSERTMLVRPLISAEDAGHQWNLRCEVREKLVTFLQQNYPHALPTLRAEISSVGSESTQDAPGLAQ